MQIKIQVESKHVTAALNDVAKRQLPFALARTLTAVAGDVRDHLKRQLPVAFDRPTPFTERGVFMQRAEKSSLDAGAVVYFPESQEQRGRGQREYLQPGVSARTYARMQKKTEYLLTRMGFLPAGWVTVPGRYIMDGKLDGYGNMPGSYYKQLIRNLQIKTHALKPITKASGKRAARMGVTNEFFAISPGPNRAAKGGGWLPPGVYKREGRSGEVLRQYLKFVRKASYRQRLDVKAEAQTAVTANLDKRFKESVQDIVTRFKPR